MPRKPRLRSFTRLVVGSVLYGLDLLSENIPAWEKQSEYRPTSANPPDNAVEQVEVVNLPGENETTGDRLGYALTGWLFAGQDRLESYWHLADRATSLAGNWAELLGGPIYNSRLVRPLRHRIDGLSERGQQAVDAWMLIGREEVDRSRRLAEAALTERVSNAIEYLTAKEEVQELVQSQSAGLVDNVVEETRERTVSADNFLEAVVRSMLRRTPRWEMPEPPQELKNSAEEGARQWHGRKIQK